MTNDEMNFIGSMNMCDEISNEAYQKIMAHCEEQEPCADCISREDFIAKVKDIYYGYMLDDDGCCPQDFVDLAEEMPFVTPQVKTGYWIRCDILQELKCSECRRCFRNKTNFCPNCGAKMEVSE